MVKRVTKTMIDVILLFEIGENRRKRKSMLFFFVVMISSGGVRIDGRVFIDLGLNNEISNHM